MAPGKADPDSVTDILARLDDAAQAQAHVPLGDVVDAFGHRSHGPFLLVPALLEISPIGAIPGVPTALALVVALFSLQMLFGRKHLWLPGFVRRRQIAGQRLRSAVRRMQPLAARADRWFHGRLCALTSGPFIRVAAIACIALAATVPMLDLLVFVSSIPMAAVALFGIALLVRDGVLMIAALVATAGALTAVYRILG